MLMLNDTRTLVIWQTQETLDIVDRVLRVAANGTLCAPAAYNAILLILDDRRRRITTPFTGNGNKVPILVTIHAGKAGAKINSKNRIFHYG